MKVMNPALPYLVRKALRKQILDKAKKVTICPHCRELNGTIKKCGLLKIVHEKYRSKKTVDPVITDALGEFAYFSSYSYTVGHFHSSELVIVLSFSYSLHFFCLFIMSFLI
jgi:DNA-directed RNA polymerase III subunit RPC1